MIAIHILVTASILSFALVAVAADFNRDFVHLGTAARPVQPDRFPTIRALDLTRYGDIASIEIEGLGRLDNRIRAT